MGPEPGVRGRGAQGKVMVEVAVEQDGRALGRCRLQVIPDVASPTLRAFMLDHVEPGSIVMVYSRGISTGTSAIALFQVTWRGTKPGFWI